uniref:mRNA decay activator protein ZFP36 n=1 Tax=Sinocyclocheilus grahami TaxID=75366 RepID=A0A672K1G1_SINGR
MRSTSAQQLQGLQQKPGSQINSTRYKTELCRPFEENGACKYGEKCQFAHGYHELRSLSRHPKYKTEPCRTFHTIGFCPYGPRCHFIHNADERRPAPSNAKSMQGESTKSQAAGAFRERPKLHHSLSFSGFSSHHQHHHGLDSPLLESPTSRTPPPPCSNRSSCATNFYEDVLSSTRNSAFSFPGQDLKALLAPLARLSESPVFDSPPS